MIAPGRTGERLPSSPWYGITLADYDRLLAAQGGR
jgi:hypothetical protein